MKYPEDDREWHDNHAFSLTLRNGTFLRLYLGEEKDAQLTVIDFYIPLGRCIRHSFPLANHGISHVLRSQGFKSTFPKLGASVDRSETMTLPKSVAVIRNWMNN